MFELKHFEGKPGFNSQFAMFVFLQLFKSSDCYPIRKINRLSSMRTHGLLWLALLLLEKTATKDVLRSRVVCSGACTCTVLGSEVTCTGSGTLTKEVVQASGTYGKFTKATIAGEITELGLNAFVGCYALVEVVVTAPVATYGYGVFDGDPLTSFTFGKSARSITPQTFNNARSLRWIDVEAGNPNYCAENGILYNFAKTQIVIIPGGLTNVTIPSSVTTLVGGCNVWSRMDRVITPDTLNVIGGHAFYQSDLSYIYIGSGVTSVDNSAFQACSNLQKVEVSPSNTAYDSTGGVFGKGTATSKSSIIHISWNATEVTLTTVLSALGSMVFVSARSLTTIKNQAGVATTSLTYKTPDGQIVMSGTAVIGCAGGATAVTIPTTATILKDSAFRNMLKLTSVTFTNQVSLEGSVFRNCEALTTINWGLCRPTNIMDHMFVLIAVPVATAPDSCKRIYSYGYANIKATSVSFAGVEEIDSYAFCGCPNLVSVLLPAIKILRSGSFMSNPNLTTVSLGSSLTQIESMAFSTCPKLQRLDLPASVTNLIAASFSYCDSLTEIKINQNSLNYCDVDGVVYNKAKTMILICPSGLTSITLLESTVAIGEQSFYGCGRLTEVRMNDDIERISRGAFYDCGSIEMVRIPGKIKFIGMLAFDSCAKLKKVLYCSNKHCDNHEDDPFPTFPEIWVFYDYTSPDNNRFCRHEVIRALDYACNIPTNPFTSIPRSLGCGIVTLYLGIVAPLYLE